MSVRRVDWEFTRPFRIAYRERTHAQTVLVEIRERNLVGRGEALGVSYRGESPDTLVEQLGRFEEEIGEKLTRAQLHRRLTAGGARHAVDCALWDLEAKGRGRRAWTLAGLPPPRPLATAYTLGVESPELMGAAAVEASPYSLLKIKVDGGNDVARVREVRKARPDARLIVDANQAWDAERLREFAPQLAQLGVELIEQPLPAGSDDVLADYKGPVPLCADESFQTAESLPSVLGKYQYVNIKLDKTGGLTEALRAARLAKEAGLKLMVGCMGGSSLSMAPAFLVAQLSDLVDLDGPLLLKADVASGIRYEGGLMWPPEARLWG